MYAMLILIGSLGILSSEHVMSILIGSLGILSRMKIE
jgi:hypothetical protein